MNKSIICRCNAYPYPHRISGGNCKEVYTHGTYCPVSAKCEGKNCETLGCELVRIEAAQHEKR